MSLGSSVRLCKSSSVWRATEPADFEDRRITFSSHTFPEGLKKYLSRDVQVYQSAHGNFSLVLDRKEFYDGLAFIRRQTGSIEDRLSSWAIARFGN
jgi:hypothetical protein